MQGKDLAKLLMGLGFEQVKSNMSALDDGDLLQVEARLSAHGLKKQPAGAEGAAPAPAKKKLLSASASDAATEVPAVAAPAAAAAPTKKEFVKKALPKAPGKKALGKKEQIAEETPAEAAPAPDAAAAPKPAEAAPPRTPS
ncbi:MAG: hypothetical protein FJ301_11805, partial [Planctomycetes bacterium]|nr:hypothetical protein [Planctomycetota bacterium]